MHHFHYRGGDLHCEDVPLADIANAVGTPVYVYSTATLKRHYRVYAEAFAPLSARVAYAVKANGNLSVLATLAQLGAGADTVSEGEIRRAMAAGVPTERIIFSGMGKTRLELTFALGLTGIQINAESEPELETIFELAREAPVRPLVALRVNPGVGAGAHRKISTGAASDKFGIPLKQVEALYRRAAQSGAVEVVGLACHLGSQIVGLGPFERAWTRVSALITRLQSAGLELRRLDLGGGLGVPFEDGEALAAPPQLGALAQEIFGGFNLEVAVEPGRAIAANAGVLVARVVQVNPRPGGATFLVLDAGMNDLIRPALYGARHAMWPLRPRGGAAVRYDSVGPVCESSDIFARAVLLPPLESGDLITFMTAGAYAASMASEYNSRPLVPEVLVDGARFVVTRPRPTFDAMLARERLAPWIGRKDAPGEGAALRQGPEMLI